MLHQQKPAVSYTDISSDTNLQLTGYISMGQSETGPATKLSWSLQGGKSILQSQEQAVSGSAGTNQGPAKLSRRFFRSETRPGMMLHRGRLLGGQVPGSSTVPFAWPWAWCQECQAGPARSRCWSVCLSGTACHFQNLVSYSQLPVSRWVPNLVSFPFLIQH